MEEKVGGTSKAERGGVYKRMKEWEGECGLSAFGGEGGEGGGEVGGASGQSLGSLCQAIFVEGFFLFLLLLLLLFPSFLLFMHFY